MKSKYMAVIILIGLFAMTSSASAQEVLRRFVLVAGANFGGADPFPSISSFPYLFVGKRALPSGG